MVIPIAAALWAEREGVVVRAFETHAGLPGHEVVGLRGRRGLAGGATEAPDVVEVDGGFDSRLLWILHRLFTTARLVIRIAFLPSVVRLPVSPFPPS